VEYCTWAKVRITEEVTVPVVKDANGFKTAVHRTIVVPKTGLTPRLAVTIEGLKTDDFTCAGEKIPTNIMAIDVWSDSGHFRYTLIPKDSTTSIPFDQQCVDPQDTGVTIGRQVYLSI
jgi:hypothetical protein